MDMNDQDESRNVEDVRGSSGGGGSGRSMEWVSAPLS